MYIRAIAREHNEACTGIGQDNCVHIRYEAGLSNKSISVFSLLSTAVPNG